MRMLENVIEGLNNGQLTCEGDDQVEGKEHEAFHIIPFSIPETSELSLDERAMAKW
jgi:hypothetical protein